MARMHPPEFHAADGDNTAERRLFEAVRDSLPEPWQAFHSIDWLERDPDEGARVGEIDFVLCHPDEGLVLRTSRRRPRRRRSALSAYLSTRCARVGARLGTSRSGRGSASPRG